MSIETRLTVDEGVGQTTAEQGSSTGTGDLLDAARERVQALLASGTPGLNEHTPWSNEQRDALKRLRRDLAQHKVTVSGASQGNKPEESSQQDPSAHQVTSSPTKDRVALVLAGIQFLLPLVLAGFWMYEKHPDWRLTSKMMGLREPFDIYAWVVMVIVGFLFACLTYGKKSARTMRAAICLFGAFLAGVVLYVNRDDAPDLGWKFVAWPVAVTILVDLMCYVSVRQEFRLILANWPVPPLGNQSDPPTRAQKRIEEQSHINALLAIISVVHVLLVLAISYVMMLIHLPDSTGTVETVRDSVFVSIALVISSCIAVGVGVYSSTHARLLETRKEFRSTLREMQRITYELDRAADHLWKKFKKEFAEIDDKYQWVPANRSECTNYTTSAPNGNSQDDSAASDKEKHSIENGANKTQPCTGNPIVLLPVVGNESPTDENRIYTEIYNNLCKECIEQIVTTFHEKFRGRFEEQWQSTRNNRNELAERCKRAPVSFHDFCEDLELFDKLFRYLDPKVEPASGSKGSMILSRLHLYASTYVQFDHFEALLSRNETPNELKHSHEAIIHALQDIKETDETGDKATDKTGDKATDKTGDLVADHPAYNLRHLWSRLQRVNFENLEYDDSKGLNSLSAEDLGKQALILELSRNRGPMLNWFRASLSASRRAKFQHITSEVLHNDHHEPKTLIGLRIMPTTSLQWSHILRTCGMPDKPERTASQRLKVMSLEDIDDSDQGANTSATTGNSNVNHSTGAH